MHSASTPVTARDRTVNRLWRAPRQPRGSVMFLKTSARGWHNRADLVEEDISAGPQDEEVPRHHSSSLRGSRLCPSDTPPPSKRLRHPHPPTLPTPCLAPQLPTVWETRSYKKATEEMAHSFSMTSHTTWVLNYSKHLAADMESFLLTQGGKTPLVRETSHNRKSHLTHHADHHH